jgi:hypothetical protein
LGDQAFIQTKISLRVELVARKTNQNVRDYTAAREEPASGKSVPDVVQSLEQNLHHVVTEIAGELDQFLSARRRATPLCVCHFRKLQQFVAATSSNPYLKLVRLPIPPPPQVSNQ